MDEDEAFTAWDDEFPLINDNTIGTVFTHSDGSTWACIYIEGLGCFGWYPLGKAR